MPRRQRQSEKRLGKTEVESWKRWGAVIDVIYRHRGEGAFVKCIIREVRDMVGPVKVDALEEDLELLAPLVVRRRDKVYLTGQLADTFYGARKAESCQAKKAVAMYVHKHLLQKLDSVLVDAGSACEAIAWEMAKGEKGHFTVLTNNMAAIHAFVTNPSIRLHLTGGYYVIDDESLIGERAVRALDGFFVKYSIIGVSGITPDHVFCHGIEGEEKVKKAIWSMPAEVLVIPATLEKFSGMDACCFGRLEQEASKQRHTNSPTDIDSIAVDAIEKTRQQEQAHRNDKALSQCQVAAPRFNAGRCEIVIEPTWMIDKQIKDAEQKSRLMAKVDQINRNSNFTKVSVVHADVTEEELMKASACGRLVCR